MAPSEIISRRQVRSFILDVPSEIQIVIVEYVFSAIYRKSHWKEGFALALAIPSFIDAIRHTLKHAQHGYASTKHFDTNLHAMRLSRERRDFFNKNWDFWNAFFNSAVSHLSGMRGDEAETFFQSCKHGISYETMMQLHRDSECRPSRDYGTPSLLQWWERSQSAMTD